MPDRGDETPKPDAARPVFRLRAALAVPAGWPPDVAPNQIITAAHINAVKASVYAWPGDVDGQNHTLSNVHFVNATGVLADPTIAAGDILARGPATIDRFPIGGAGQVLTVDTSLPQKLKWATPALAPVLSFNTRIGAVMPQAGDYTAAMVTGALADPLTTKGDLIARGAVTGRMPVGVDGQVLRVDSSQTFGLRWGGESVASVFGRGGPVVAQAGDYAASQVTNAVSTIATYPDPAWLTSLSWGKLIGLPSSFTPAAHTHDAAAIVTGVMAPARLGSGVADATVYLRGDGAWAAAGTGGGGGVVSVFGRAGAVIAQAGDYTAPMVGAVPDNLLTSTGDLIVRNNVNALTRLPIGANGQVLQTDLATSVGMKWTSISASVQTPWVTNIDAAAFNLTNVGRLGVALAVPNYAVDVVGDVNYTGVLRSNGVPVVFGGSQTPWTQNINASGFSLNNAGTVGIGVAAPQAAPLQVATHTPGIAGSLAVQDLDATTAGNPVLLVTGLGSEGTRSWAVGNRGGATYGKDLYVWNDRASALLFGTNSAERMRITAAGLVGIGRTPATYPLEVQGDVSVTGAYRINGVPISTGGQTPWTSDIDGAGFTLKNVGKVGIGTASPRSLLSVIPAAAPSGVAGANQITIGENGNNAGYQFSLGYTVLSSAWYGVIDVLAGGAATPLLLNPSGGNVGIGTASPISPLTVVGGATLSGTASFTVAVVQDFTNYRGLYFGYDTAGQIGVIAAATSGPASNIAFYTYSGGFAERMRITSAGNVGIGTTTPATFLDVASSNGVVNSFDSAGAIRIYTNDAFAIDKGPQLRFAGHTGMGGSQEIYSFGVIAGRKEAASAGYDGYLQFCTNTAGGLYERMRITSTGRVGIGAATASPLGMLQVYDSTGGSNIIIGYNGVAANYFDANTTTFRNTSGAVLMTMLSNGNVGLGGITNPIYQFQLNVDSAAKPGTSSWAIASDTRLKRNIRDLVGGLDVIARLRPIEAEYNGLAGTPEGLRVLSFLAEEIREILPHTVRSHRVKLHPKDKTETDILDFNIHEVLMHLVLAVKQLAAKLPTS